MGSPLPEVTSDPLEAVSGIGRQGGEQGDLREVRDAGLLPGRSAGRPRWNTPVRGGGGLRVESNVRFREKCGS
jgi:hypothetical protein